jgi:uncharacterized membrane protein YphA (DoxX/SURF4 family)
VDVGLEVLALAGRFFLGLVVLRAGVSKLLAQGDFESVVRRYDVLPDRLVGPFARWLPRTEAALGVALVVGVATRLAAALVAVLLAVFVVAITVNLARGRSIDCGCRSTAAPTTIGWPVVAKDTGLFGLAILVAASVPTTLAADSSWDAQTAIPTSEGVAILIATSASYTCAVLLLQAAHVVRGGARAFF